MRSPQVGSFPPTTLLQAPHVTHCVCTSHRSVLDTEEALRDVLTQEAMAIEPKIFRALQLDINSIRISRESGLGECVELGGY